MRDRLSCLWAPTAAWRDERMARSPPHSAGEGYGCQISLMVFTLPSPSSVMS